MNRILNLNLNNKSVPKKLNNYKLIKNKYYIYNPPPYLKNFESYQKNLNEMNCDYAKNHIPNVKINNILPQSKDILAKLPRRLIPIKKPM